MEAEQLYRDVLQRQPGNVDALRLLGVLASSVGHTSAGIELLRRAARVAPQEPLVRGALAEMLTNEAEVLQEQGRLDASIPLYREALALNPQAAATWNNLGVALRQRGDIAGAVDAYCRATSVRPDYPEAYNNLSDALRMLGRAEEALAAAREALRLRPDYANAYDHMGSALLNLGRREEAVAAHQTAIRRDPNSAHAHNNLGNALAALERTDEARQSYAKAVAIDPTFSEAMSNLGNVLRDYGQFVEAVEMHRRALSIKPNFPELHNNYGNALRDAGEVEAALAEYRTAVQLNPQFAHGWSNLLFNMNFVASFSAEQILAEHLKWAREVAREVPKPQAARPSREGLPGRRLRIGYVSADLRDHPAGRFMLPLLANHDRSRFEVFCYADIVRVDHVSERLRAHTDTFRQTIALTDAQLLEQIRGDRVDILVDLSVHSAGNRLLVLAKKPAPIQVTYLGYPGTTGLSAIDYRLTDQFLDPPNESRPFYSERSMHLRTTYWCYCEIINAPPARELPMASNGQVTFGCLNSFAKVSAPALQTWAELLARVPRSRLIVHAPAGPHRDRALHIFHQRGISDDRVEFVPRMSIEEYFAAFGRIDIALDPFPCPGGTTTCDGMWMGVPVITLAGDCAARRGGVSLMSLIGLPDLIADTAAQYIEVASALAGDSDRLSDLRRTLRERMRRSPIMGEREFARDVERCYLEMWGTA